MGKARRRGPACTARRHETGRPLAQATKAGQLDGAERSELPGGVEEVQESYGRTGPDGPRAIGRAEPTVEAEARYWFVIGIRRSLPKPRLVTRGPGGA